MSAKLLLSALMATALMLTACGESGNSATETGGNSRKGAPANPVEVAGTTQADVSTFEAYVEALSDAFISGDDASMAAVVVPNRDMMQAHILQHNGPANAQAAIEMLDTTMPADLSRVLGSLKSARQAAIESGFDPSDASFDSAQMVSGLRIGGMKVNTLGMNLKSGDRVFAFELKESRDILGRWVTMGNTSFEGVTSAKPLENDDGSLDLDL